MGLNHPARFDYPSRSLRLELSGSEELHQILGRHPIGIRQIRVSVAEQGRIGLLQQAARRIDRPEGNYVTGLSEAAYAEIADVAPAIALGAEQMRDFKTLRVELQHAERERIHRALLRILFHRGAAFMGPRHRAVRGPQVRRHARQLLALARLGRRQGVFAGGKRRL